MFSNNGFFAFHPFSHMRDEFPVMGRGPGDLLDKWMEILEPWNTGALVSDPSPWSRIHTHTRCCPHACLLDRPQRSSRQHFVILPSLLTEPTRSDQEGGDQKSEKDTACSQQCQGKETASSEQKQSAATSKDAAPEKSPWQFSVDMKGCDEVRAMTEGGMLMVEGRGSSDTSQQIVRYITSLPRHVSHDSLTASLNNGRLTVTQKAGAQLEGQARTLPIDVQQKKAPEPEEQKKQQQQSETAEKAQ